VFLTEMEGQPCSAVPPVVTPQNMCATHFGENSNSPAQTAGIVKPRDKKSGALLLQENSLGATRTIGPLSRLSALR
jgi:hypothetical protein